MDLCLAFSELRKRNWTVPKPLRLPSENEVDSVEASLGVRFHPDFRRYLLEASDVVFGIFEPVTITQPGTHTDLLKVASHAWEAYGVPRDLLPICEDNADFYCMNEGGEVVFWSHNGWSSETWPKLADWIERVWIAESEGECP
jgi:hypothetical protein